MAIVQELAACPNPPFVIQKILVKAMLFKTASVVYGVQILTAGIIVEGNGRVIEIRQRTGAKRLDIILAGAAKAGDLKPAWCRTISRERGIELVNVFQIAQAFV